MLWRTISLPMKEAGKEYCRGYCGVTCVNGYCPNALSNYDNSRDDDLYSCYHLDKPVRCDECGYYKGCEDCFFNGTEMCIMKTGKSYV